MKKLVTRLSRRSKVSEGDVPAELVPAGVARPAKRDIHHGFQQVYPVPNPKGKGRDESTVDIIAIHGLETSAPTTWEFKYEDDGKSCIVNWLSDENMLPSFVPNSRIFTYNWHADYSKASVDLTLRDHANAFLLDLRAARQKEDEALDRPIVFIASCFGGLVVIKALTIAASAAGQDYRFLRQATVGIIFLGTPFKGSPTQRLAQWLLAYQGFVGEPGSDTLLKSLDISTGILNDLNDQFMREANQPYYRLPLHCFYETVPTNLSKKVLPASVATRVSLKRLMVTQDSACLHGWDHTPLDCNHTRMNKFAPDSENFRRVVFVIQKFVSETKDTLEQRNRIHRDNLIPSSTASPAENTLIRRSPIQQNGPFVVPFGRNKGFVGREIILEQLISKIPPATDEDDCQITVIEGLGGVGKTQIALETAYRVHKMDPECSIFWVPAVNSSMLEQAYREIGRKLNVQGIEDDEADVNRLVKAALEEESSGRWLLVVDNLDDPGLVFGKKGVDGAPDDNIFLVEGLPFSRKGSILVTTRNHAVALEIIQSVQDIVTVEEMNATDALKLLTTTLRKGQADDTATSKALLQFLCNLPLAIRQASAFMVKNQITVAKYLEFCQSSDKDMVEILSKDFEDRYRYKEIQNPVATTWLISFRHILDQDPLAATYLRYMCFLAEKDIPQSLLPSDDKIKVAEALGTLKAFAFITERDEPNTYDMHRLVRMSMLNWLALRGERREWKTNVIKGLKKHICWPRRVNKSAWERCVPHVQCALEVPGEVDDKVIEGKLYRRLGRCYYFLWKPQQAESIYKHSLGILRESLGEEHEVTLALSWDLAVLLGRNLTGRVEEGIQMLKQVISVQERVLGIEHPVVITRLARLAAVFEDGEMYDDAEKLRWQILNVQREKFGERHGQTLTAKMRLAKCLDFKGEFEDAEKICRLTLDNFVEILGEEHETTLECMRRLARNLQEQGKFPEAEILCRRALEASRKTLGADAPGTLDQMSTLSLTLVRQNKYDEAGDILQRLVELRERVFGRDHSTTLVDLYRFSEVLHEQGNYEEAERLLREVVKSTHSWQRYSNS